MRNSFLMDMFKQDQKFCVQASNIHFEICFKVQLFKKYAKMLIEEKQV